MRFGPTVKKQTIKKKKIDSHSVFDEKGKENFNSKILCVGDTESHQGLPYDLPSRLIIHRLVSDFENENSDLKTKGLKGWVIEHEIFRQLNQKEKSFDVAMKIHIKIVRDGRIAIFIDKKKVFEGNALKK